MTAAVLIAAILLVVLSFRYGSVDAAKAYLEGQSVALVPSSVDLGLGDAGESRQVEFTVANFTPQPIKILGAQSDCTCTVAMESFPLEIPAHQTRKLSVSVRFEGRDESFVRSVTAIYGERQQVTAAILGTIRQE